MRDFMKDLGAFNDSLPGGTDLPLRSELTLILGDPMLEQFRRH